MSPITMLPNGMNEVGEANKLKRVILIDDDKATNYLNRKVVEKTRLSQDIIAITSCENALNFLDETSSSDSGKSLILLDLKIPSMDGYEFIEVLQQKNYFKNLVIVVLTDFEIDGDTTRFNKLRDFDIILKPLIEDDLWNIWNKYYKE